MLAPPFRGCQRGAAAGGGLLTVRSCQIFHLPLSPLQGAPEPKFRIMNGLHPSRLEVSDDEPVDYYAAAYDSCAQRL